MKKLILCLLGFMYFAIPTYVLAQNNSDEGNSKKGFNIASAGYDLMFLNYTEKDVVSGANLQIIHDFKLANFPLYLETGIGITFNSGEATIGEKTSKSNIPELKEKNITFNYWENIKALSVYIPLNLGYEFHLNKKLGIMPYTGIQIKINPIFDSKAYCDVTFPEIPGGLEIEKNTNINSRLQNYCQFSWNIGLKFFISKIYVGAQYALDLMPEANYNVSSSWSIPNLGQNGNFNSDDILKPKSSHLTISLGYLF